MLIRVAMITELFPPSLGGQEFRFYSIAKTLVSKGVETHVYTIKFKEDLSTEEVLDGIKVLRYIELTRYAKDGSRYLTSLLKYARETRKVLSRISSEYDVIILNQMPIAHLLYVPQNHTDSVIVDVCEVYRAGLLKLLLDTALKRYKKFTCVSDYICEYVTTLRKSHAKVRTVRTPLDLTKYYVDIYKKEHNLILYAGRLVKHKNVLELIKGVIKANEAVGYNKLRLVILGKGPLAPVVEGYALRYPSAIEYIGFVDESTKIEFFKRAWLLAIPSRREGFPNVVAEAIASSTPVLTINSKYNSLAQEIKRYNVGIVCDGADKNSLAKCLNQLNELKWVELVENTKKLAQEFDLERVSRLLLNIVSEEALMRW